MSNTAKKTPLNIKEIKIFPITDEEQGTYGTALDLSGRARSATDTPTVNSTELWGDGELQEVAYASGTGSLALALNFLTDSDRQVLFSETADTNGANVVTGDEEPKPVVVAFKTICDTAGKIVNLYKFFAVAFPPSEESIAQIEGNSINYSTIQITGSYRKNKHNNLVKAFKRHVDTSTESGQALVQSWFADAETSGSNGFSNTSTIKVGDNVIANGGTIASGSTVTFVGSSTGGTPTVTYSYAYRAVGSDSWITPSDTTCTVTVATDAAYEFRITATDGNGVVLSKTYTVTVTASE